MEPKTIGFALCGSFCTFARVHPEIERLTEAGYRVIPIMSEAACGTDTRFGAAEEHRARIERVTGNPIISTIAGAEPIGPKGLLDALVIAPCTGNTLAKLAAGIADTPVTLAAKSHLRNGRPLLIAVSTNDALAAAAKNIGALQNYKHIYFVPYKQDAPEEKPNSAVADFTLLPRALELALEGRQMQPVLL